MTGRLPGKIVLNMQTTGPYAAAAKRHIPTDRCYLIPRCQRFWAEIGRWLADRGARHLVCSAAMVQERCGSRSRAGDERTGHSRRLAQADVADVDALGR